MPNAAERVLKTQISLLPVGFSALLHVCALTNNVSHYSLFHYNCVSVFLYIKLGYDSKFVSAAILRVRHRLIPASKRSYFLDKKIGHRPKLSQQPLLQLCVSRS